MQTHITVTQRAHKLDLVLEGDDGVLVVEEVVRDHLDRDHLAEIAPLTDDSVGTLAKDVFDLEIGKRDLVLADGLCMRGHDVVGLRTQKLGLGPLHGALLLELFELVSLALVLKYFDGDEEDQNGDQERDGSNDEVGQAAR